MPAIDEDLAGRDEAAVVGGQEGDDFATSSSVPVRARGVMLAAYP